MGVALVHGEDICGGCRRPIREGEPAVLASSSNAGSIDDQGRLRGHWRHAQCAPPPHLGLDPATDHGVAAARALDAQERAQRPQSVVEHVKALAAEVEALKARIAVLETEQER